MKVSYNWLKKFIDLKLTPAETADLLTFIGNETVVLSVGHNWSKVITAQVLSVEKHPNADKLSVCLVDDGSNKYNIVCGAKNVAAGQIVPLSLIGAVLPGNFEIKKSKIRGIESEGMICSESELGLSEKSDGIMVLPPDTKIGISLETILPETDSILEVNITPNRGDCLSHLGIARELSAKLQRPIIMPLIKQASRTQVISSVKIESKLCSRYIGTIIKDVKIAPSPKWLADSLIKCGIRPINNIVDITNYVMIELGQPLHAFDISKLNSQKIIVRLAEDKEEILALDGKTYTLDSEMLIIADENQPVAVAGIMGGELSGINEDTKTIFLESAIFNYSSVRKTSKKLKLASESSYRFERGISWDICELASWRAENLIASIAGGHLDKREDVKNIEYNRTEILLRFERIAKVLGYSIDKQKIAQILRFLGIDLQPRLEVMVCSIPSWRNDIKDEIDLIEEIVRINGYEKIPQQENASVFNENSNNSFFPKIAGEFRKRLYGLGFSEALNYSFSEINDLEKFGLKYSAKIMNPASKENEVLRPSMLPALYNNALNNIGQGAESISLFEYGKIYAANGERKTFAGIMFGAVWDEWWAWEEMKNAPKYDFYFGEGIIKNILPEKEFSIAENQKPHPYFHIGKTAAIVYRGKAIGQFGIVNPSITSDLKGEVFYFEIDLEEIENAMDKTPVFKPFMRFPPVKRDLSIIADKGIAFSKIDNIIKNMGRNGGILKEYSLFSVYSDKKKIGEDKISYSLRLLYRNDEKTMTDEEVNADLKILIERLQQELKIELRK